MKQSQDFKALQANAQQALNEFIDFFAALKQTQGKNDPLASLFTPKSLRAGFESVFGDEQPKYSWA